MPVLENAVNTRLEIIRVIYNLSGEQSGKTVTFFAAQISGGYYGEIYHQLRFLQEKGLVSFSRNMISKRFSAELTESGLSFMMDAYGALSLADEEKDEALKEVFSRIKV